MTLPTESQIEEMASKNRLPEWDGNMQHSEYFTQTFDNNEMTTKAYSVRLNQILKTGQDCYYCRTQIICVPQ